jgi:hypothetical protein
MMDFACLDRHLAQAGITCPVVDLASLKVDRRARRVKTATGSTPRASCRPSSRGGETAHRGR